MPRKKLVVAAAACLSSLALVASLTTFLIKSDPRDSVVKLVGLAGGSCTGFELKTPDGTQVTVTNKHCCEAGITNAFVNDHILPLNILSVAPTTDLCILQGIGNLPALDLADEAPQNGDDLTVIGYGLGFGPTTSNGKFVQVIAGDMLDVYGAYYLTAQILPGNSGSPVLNSRGQVVGVAFASGGAVAFRALAVSLDDLRWHLSR